MKSKRKIEIDLTEISILVTCVKVHIIDLQVELKVNSLHTSERSIIVDTIRMHEQLLVKLEPVLSDLQGADPRN